MPLPDCPYMDATCPHYDERCEDEESKSCHYIATATGVAMSNLAALQTLLALEPTPSLERHAQIAREFLASVDIFIDEGN